MAGLWLVVAVVALLAVGSAVVAGVLRRPGMAAAYPERLKWRLGAEGVWLGLLLLMMVLPLMLLLALMRGNPLEHLFNVGTPTTLLLAAPAALLVARGTFDFSIGGVVVLSSIVTALLSHSLGDMAPLAGIGIGLAVGLLNGLLTSCTGTPPLLLTLGIGVAARALGGYLANGTMVNASLSSAWHGPLVGVVLAGVTVVWVAGLAGMAMFTRMGRGERGQSADEETLTQRMATLGLPLVLSGLAAGLVGVVMVLRLGAGNTSAAASVEMEVALTVLLGGTCLGGRHAMVIGAGLAALGVAMGVMAMLMMELSGSLIQLFLGPALVTAALATQAYASLVGWLFNRRESRHAPAFPVQLSQQAAAPLTRQV